MKSLNKIIVAAMLSLSLANIHAKSSLTQLPQFNTPESSQANQMSDLYAAYFDIKDALVKSDGKAASAKALLLSKSIAAVKMDEMSSEQHAAWMKVLSELKEDAEHIAETNDAKHQRDHFVTLSKNMHEVMKIFPAGETVYYQKCPMANGGKGANWLSKEKAVKNPYYGSAMLTCGSTIETLK